MDIASLLIQLVSGAIGGNLAGGLMKKQSLGTAGNSIVGILGGGLGGWILGQLGMGGGGAAAGMDVASIISNIAGGGVGGGVLLAIVGVIKNMMAKS